MQIEWRVLDQARICSCVSVYDAEPLRPSESSLPRIHVTTFIFYRDTVA